MLLILQMDISLLVSPWISASNPFTFHLNRVCYSTLAVLHNTPIASCVLYFLRSNVTVRRFAPTQKVFLFHALNAYRGSRSTASLFLTFTSHSGHFTPGKETQDSLNRRLDVPQSQYGLFRKTKTSLDDWLTVHRSITLVDSQPDAQNSYLFTYKIIHLLKSSTCFEHCPAHL